MFLLARYLVIVPPLAAFCENPERLLPETRAKTSPRTEVIINKVNYPHSGVALGG